MSVRWGVYGRISMDRFGAGLGVERQHFEVTEHVSALGGEVARYYADNDVSAYKRKRRPGYEQMFAEAKAGLITGIAAWHIDRLTRHPAELEYIIDFVTAHDLSFTLRTGEVDVGTPTGRLAARMMGSVARYEVEHRSERLVAKHAELARAGHDAGGQRAFGYQKGRREIEPGEAEILRKLAERALLGESARSLTRWLTAEGVPTVTGAAWSPTVVRQMLINPRYAGLRRHNGVVVGKATWPPILDDLTHRRLVAQFTDPSRSTVQTRSRVNLLGGLAHCALCDAKLYRHVYRDAPGYVCISGYPGNGCGRIRIKSTFLEDRVSTETVARILAAGGIEAILAVQARGDDGRARELAEFIAAQEQRIADLRTAFTDVPDADPALFVATSAGLTRRINEAKQQLRTLAPVAAFPVDALDDLVGWWDTADLPARRAVIDTMVEKVTVTSGKRGARFLDPARVHIVWR